MVGAVCGSTMRARSPSGTNSTTLCGWSAASAAAIAVTVKAVDSRTLFRIGRMGFISPRRRFLDRGGP
jgi:hypothetical protein